MVSYVKVCNMCLIVQHPVYVSKFDIFIKPIKDVDRTNKKFQN